MSVAVTHQKQFVGGEFVESSSGETMGLILVALLVYARIVGSERLTG